MELGYSDSSTTFHGLGLDSDAFLLRLDSDLSVWDSKDVPESRARDS